MAGVGPGITGPHAAFVPPPLVPDRDEALFRDGELGAVDYAVGVGHAGQELPVPPPPPTADRAEAQRAAKGLMFVTKPR